MDNKKLYTRKELDKIMYEYIKETANDLKIDLLKVSKNKSKLDNNSIIYA